MRQKNIQKVPTCMSTQIIRAKWNKKEDNLLKKGIRICGMNWMEIAQYVPNRNPNQCAQRWKRLQGKRSRKNQLWQPEEDEQLIYLVQKIGKKWSKIAEMFQNRTGKQCRGRYTNTLDPDLKLQDFTQEEDQLIYEKYLEIGPKWSQIQKLLQGRSDSQIKNRFYSRIRTQYLQIQNPYYSKLTPFQSRKILEKAREDHLKNMESSKKAEIIFDQNDFHRNELNYSCNLNFQDNSNYQYEYYSDMNQDGLSMDFQYIE
ncbi:unnamed protein product [Paramecium primaurelia]|uniref:Myb-like DNA-binding domain protein n=1 Tax=Paramecium primaurelia TaxID=5886 RepID=A0A8S1KUV9_PARPR|nr:unnamed protein product [Paramecium primaurelia]